MVRRATAAVGSAWWWRVARVEHRRRGVGSDLDRWPLAAHGFLGRLSCEGTSARPVPWFEGPDGRMWPLNGIAMGEAARRGGVFQTDLTPIHAVDEDLMAELRAAGASEDGPIVRISVGALGDRARSLCE